MTLIPTARQSKQNWMNTYLKHCSRLNKNCDTILIGDSLIAGLTCYSKVWNIFLKPLNALNCEIRHVSSYKLIFILQKRYNMQYQYLYQYSPDDIANGLLEIVSCLKL